MLERNIVATIARMKKNSLRPHSSILVDGPERAAARAMLYPVGFTNEGFKKPTPCNMHINQLA